MSPTTPRCPVCGHDGWTRQQVIWPELARQWELSADEVAYVDHQQGTTCDGCGTSLRSAALADAVSATLGWGRPWHQLPARVTGAVRTLEINEAGTLTPHLRRWSGHRLVEYPDVDMQDLPFEDDSFDLVLHSDTLEHVPDPVKGLAECRRVLRPGGFLAYTIPLVVGRLGRTRAGLEPSFHGAEGQDNYLVHTEYGADFWTEVVRAGFEQVTVHAFDHPAAHAVVARTTLRGADLDDPTDDPTDEQPRRGWLRRR